MAFNGQSIQRRIWRAEHLSAELQKHAQRGDEPKCLLQPRVLCQAEFIILRLLDAPAAYRDVCLRVWKSLKHGLTVEPQYITHQLVQRARNLLAKALQTTYAKPAWVCDIRDVPAYYHFTPRPDNVPEMDEQTSYVYSKDTGVSFCLGGNGAGTTTTSLLKACKFMLETPPPRRNTPFWFIAESYEQIGSIYDEKIAQFGLIPPHIIDKDRIHWNKRNNNWPFRVPLISPEGPGGRNWTMEFKGWRQGRGQFQARAVGGFCFIEQFPWVILDETLRGAREFNIPGSKMAEYTPVDPSMSQEIEEMIENGVDPGMGNRANKDAKYLPEGWKVYHMNTKCAKDHGHVSEAWFKEFFSMIPDSMLDVRMKGLFASFEGVIYPEFMPQIHCCGDEIWPIVHSESSYHLRGIDWGTGPDNPFVCLWAAVASDGTTYIYDEYYSNSSDCTIIDHLVNVQEQWEWSNSPQFGMTYADPSDPGNFRIASRLNEYARKHCDKVVKNISMGRAKNAVYEGIEHVRLMLKPSLKRAVMDPNTLKVEEKLMPRLMIHRGNCPNLVREMKAYRWMQPGDHTTAANPRNAPRQPCKFNDHACDAARYLLFTHASAAGATIESIRRNSQMRDAVDDYSAPVIDDSAMESYAVSRRADVIGSHRKRGND